MSWKILFNQPDVKKNKNLKVYVHVAQFSEDNTCCVGLIIRGSEGYFYGAKTRLLGVLDTQNTVQNF